MKLIFKVVCLALIVVFLTGDHLVEGFWSKFMRGRRFNNFKRLATLPESPIPEQYYDQRLDHFNEALKTTWKQVKLHLIPLRLEAYFSGVICIFIEILDQRSIL